MGEEERQIRAKVIVSPTALEQMEKLTGRYGEKVLEWCDLLALFPFAGARMPQDDIGEFRRIVIAPFVLIYEFVEKEHAVHVLWIQHGRMLLPDAAKLCKAEGR